MALQINKKRILFFKKVNLGELLTLNNETIWKKERPPTPVFWPEEFMDTGAWQAAVHGGAKNRTQLSDFHTHNN